MIAFSAEWMAGQFTPLVDTPCADKLLRVLTDQKFLVLAEIGRSDMLVTGDHALLCLEGQTCFAMIKPSVFREQVKRSQ